MWDFMWHMRGSAAVEVENSDRELLDHIATAMKEEGMFDIRIMPTSAEFKGSIFRTRAKFKPSDLLMPRSLRLYDRGIFILEGVGSVRKFSYDLRCLHLFLLCLAGSLAILGYRLATSGGDPVAALSSAAFAFAWLYGMNMLIAWTTIPRGIRATINGGRTEA